MGLDITDMAACGGGAVSALWRSMLADLYGCEVKTLSSKEGPALGAAILAAVGAGIYSSVPQACGAIVKQDKLCRPDAQRVQLYEQYYRLYRKLYPSLKAGFSELAQL
jgi:xylulokinase